MIIPATIPALAKIALIFTVIIFAIRKNFSLGNAFLTGVLLLAVFFRLSPGETVVSLLNGLSHPKTITLCLMVLLILIFSHSLEQCGQMRRLLNSFRGLVKNQKLNLAVFPALIGLLPMPGGAIFSAPMVKELGEHSGFSPAALSYINYWFRHIWEYWWPMYPGVLLATLLADINLGLFILLMIPFTLVVMQLGWLPLDRSRLKAIPAEKPGPKSLGPFVKEITPIAVIILAGISLGWGLSALAPALTIAKELGLIISLLAGNLMVWQSNKLSRSQIVRLLKNRQGADMVYMVAAILVFRQILEDSSAIDQICAELIGLNVPLVAICVLLPMIIGLLTGITIAFVGGTFPILISLIIAYSGHEAMTPYIILALTCGFVGVLMSPVHLCLLLSNRYFNTGLKPVYAYLWLPCLCLTGCALGYFFLLRRLI